LGEEDSSGTLRHSLLIHRDDEGEGAGSLYVEFNDPSNICSGSSLDLIELSDHILRLRFKPTSSMCTRELHGLPGPRLDELAAFFSLPDRDLAGLRARLTQITTGACAFRYVGHTLRTPDP
jgi:hypothetical protein